MSPFEDTYLPISLKGNILTCLVFGGDEGTGRKLDCMSQIDGIKKYTDISSSFRELRKYTYLLRLKEKYTYIRSFLGH